MDVAVLAVWVRVLVSPGRRGASFAMVSVALTTYLVADILYAFMALAGTYGTGSWIDSGWIAFYVLWGAAALHPSMHVLTERAVTGGEGLTRTRLVLLATASMVAPAVLLLKASGSRGIEAPVIALGSALMFVLVVVRMSGLVRQLEDLSRELEDRVTERAAQLSEANRALDRSLRHVKLAYAREREATRRLRELDQLKSDFVSTVSHELRTPLTAISGFTQTLRQRWHDLDESLRSDILDRIALRSGKLDRLIGELLDFSRVENGSVELDIGPCDVSTAVVETIAGLESALARHPVTTELDGAPTVLADRHGLERVLENLLTNAVKFSPPGSPIAVVVRPRARDVVITVADRGSGVPEAERSRIFDRFYRGQRSDRVLGGGTGIGLALVKQYVEAQGGRVWVKPRSGGGSVFGFTVPRAAPHGGTLAATGTSGRSTRRR